jgi:hypothetical protein
MYFYHICSKLEVLGPFLTLEDTFRQAETRNRMIRNSGRDLLPQTYPECQVIEK